MTTAGLSERVQLKMKTCLEEGAEGEMTHVWMYQLPLSHWSDHEDHRVSWRFEHSVKTCLSIRAIVELSC